MPPRLREDKRRKTLLAMPQHRELVSGPHFLRHIESGAYRFRSAFDSEDERRAAYLNRRDDVARDCERMPRGRPWAWWFYEATDADLRKLHASRVEHERAFGLRLMESTAHTAFVGTDAQRMC